MASLNNNKPRVHVKLAVFCDNINIRKYRFTTQGIFQKNPARNAFQETHHHNQLPHLSKVVVYSQASVEIVSTNNPLRRLRAFLPFETKNKPISTDLTRLCTSRVRRDQDVV